MNTQRAKWRFILEIVGAALAVAGFACLLIAYWDKLTECFASLTEKIKAKRSCELDDFEDDLLYE